MSSELFFRAMGSDAHVIVVGGCEQLADEDHVAALVVDDRGEIVMSEGFAAFTGVEA